MITCLLFDLDGTLFDNTAANVAAYAQAFGQVGVAFDEAAYRQVFGRRFSEMMDRLAPDTTPEVRDAIKALKTQFYKDNLSLVQPHPGLLNLALSSQGKFTTALVTTASRVNVENLLAHFEIQAGTFDTIITGEDVTHGKPNPECYLAAMQALDVQPGDCCIFEDSPVGLEAAERSGAHVIKVAL